MTTTQKIIIGVTLAAAVGIGVYTEQRSRSGTESTTKEAQSGASAVLESNPGLASIDLERIRKAVAANEALLNPIRLHFTTEFHTKVEAGEPQTGRLRAGRRFSHDECEWAQKGRRHYAKLSTFFSSDELYRTKVYVIDETNWTSAVLPDWSSRATQPRATGLMCYGYISITALGLRPFVGDYPLSEVLQPPWSTFSGLVEEIDGRPAVVVDARRRAIDPEAPISYARLWIDLERGVALRIRYFDYDASVDDRHLMCTIDGIKHRRLPNGGWLPVEGTRTLPFRDEPRVERIKVEWDGIKSSASDIPDSLFAVPPLPPREDQSSRAE